jgi:hypothetical protein
MELLYNALVVVFVVYWALMLVNAARTKQWGWFVLIFLVPFAFLVYRFLAYRSFKKLRADENRRTRNSLRREQARRNELESLRAKVERLESERGAHSN